MFLKWSVRMGCCSRHLRTLYKTKTLSSSSLRSLIPVHSSNMSSTGALQPTLSDDIPGTVETVKRTMDDLTAEELKRLRVMKLEYDVWQQMGHKVPDDMTDERWIDILNCASLHQRRKLYSYYFSLQVATEMTKRQKEKKRLERENHEVIPRNTFYFYIRPKSMVVVENSRIAQAMQFELPLVIDLDYEQYMRQQETTNLVRQILVGHGINKDLLSPFHFLFTGARPGPIMNAFHHCTRNTKPLSEYMFTITQKCYRDIFPREQLVYLTPNAPDVMKRFDHDTVYIIGGFVDKSHPKPISMARAKEQGIKMERLPLEYFVRWGTGSKCLSVDQMVGIMGEVKNSGNWEKAFKYIPSRKLMKEDHLEWRRNSDSPIVLHHST